MQNTKNLAKVLSANISGYSPQYFDESFGDDYLRPYGVYKAVNEFSFSKKISIGFSDYGNQYFFIKN